RQKKIFFAFLLKKMQKNIHVSFFFHTFARVIYYHNNYEEENINLGRQGNDSQSAVDIPYE
ncbi:MAG: hypothetical protein ACI3ZD_01360, partial [Prevotella sp.]